MSSRLYVRVNAMPWSLDEALKAVRSTLSRARRHAPWTREGAEQQGELPDSCPSEFASVSRTASPWVRRVFVEKNPPDTRHSVSCARTPCTPVRFSVPRESFPMLDGPNALITLVVPPHT
jgi:hypothetical protein